MQNGKEATQRCDTSKEFILLLIDYIVKSKHHLFFNLFGVLLLAYYEKQKFRQDNFINFTDNLKKKILKYNNMIMQFCSFYQVYIIHIILYRAPIRFNFYVFSYTFTYCVNSKLISICIHNILFIILLSVNHFFSKYKKKKVLFCYTLSKS